MHRIKWGWGLLLVGLLGCGDDGASPSDAAADADAGVDTGPPDSAAADTACMLPVDSAVTPVDAGPAEPPPALDCGTPTFPSGTGLRRVPYLQTVGHTSARVAWTTTSGGSGSLFYAADPSGPFTQVAATGELFTTSRTGDAVEYVAHEARLAGLTPNAAYCYRIEEDGVVLADHLRFDTAWEGTDRPVRIVAFGDSGAATPEQMEVRDRLLEREYDVFLHLGDMAYGSGTFPELEERVFDVYRDFMHRVPSFPTMGNHEFNTDMGQPYLDVYYLPEVALRDEEQERYYSFDYGNVHFVSLDSNDVRLAEIRFQEGGLIEQTHDLMTDWLRADLAASDAEWKIAFFHHPPYTSSTRGFNALVIEALRLALEEGGVDLVLSGHDHHYERMVPTRAGCAAPPDDGITYIIAGAGGAGLRDLPGREWMSAAAEDQVHSFLELDIRGCFAHGRAVSMFGDVIDDFWLDGCDD